MPHLSIGATCPTLLRTLGLDDRGADVSQLQQFLGVPASGYFDITTQQALRAWQKSRGIVSSGTPATTGYGITGPKTRAAIARCASAISIVAPTPSPLPIVGTTPAPSNITSGAVRTLTFGMRGDDVMALQQSLTTLGFLASGNASGYFGSLTLAAVQSFQRSKTIVSSGSPSTTGYGSVGPKTRALITNNRASTPTPYNPPPPIIPTASATVPATPISPPLIGPVLYPCVFNGQSIGHGRSVTAYQSSSVAPGSQCVSESRTCTNGILNGSYTNAACSVQTAAATVTPPAVMVGFWGIIGDVGDLDNRDYLAETAPYTNTAFILASLNSTPNAPVSPYAMQKIAEAVQQGKKIVIWDQQLFFANDSRVGPTLASDYKARFDSLWAALAQYQSSIVGFEFIDEPYGDGSGLVTPADDAKLKADIALLVDYMHQKAPGRVAMTTFAYPTVLRSDFASLIPPNLDLIGVNCYLQFGAVCAPDKVMSLIQTIANAKSSSQRLYITLDGWWQTDPTAVDDAAMLNQIYAWEMILKPYLATNQVGALFPFVYQASAHGTSWGIENFTAARNEIQSYLSDIANYYPTSRRSFIPIGQFKQYGDPYSIYYSNGQGAYCGYASFNNYKAAGGPDDTTTLLQTTIPWTMRYDGAC